VLLLRRYERVSTENRRFRSNAVSLTHNFRQMGSPTTNHSSYHNAKLNDLLYRVKILAELSFVLSQCTRLTDRQTDGRTDWRTDSFLVTRPPCIQCSAVKIGRCWFDRWICMLRTSCSKRPHAEVYVTRWGRIGLYTFDQQTGT